MAEAKKARSRKAPGKTRDRPGEYVGFRSPPELKAKLEDAAKGAGRSLSSEAQFRLEQSFEREARLGGPELHQISQLAAAAFWHAGAQQARMDGLPTAPKSWLHDPACYGSAVAAVIFALIAGDPERDDAIRHARVSQMLTRLAFAFPPPAAKPGENT